MTTYLYCVCILSLLFIVYYTLIGRPLNARKAITKGTTYQTPSLFSISCVLFPITFMIILYKMMISDFLNIPSASMLPTFEIGSIVKVDKQYFGMRNPLSNSQITSMNAPDRGDVVVTQFPLNKAVNYIKRVIGLPGDTVSVLKDRININGTDYPFIFSKNKSFSVKDETIEVALYEVVLNDRKWQVAIDLDKQFNELTGYNVPEDGYFLLGDHLTASSDSRDFGAITSKLFIGKAAF